MAKTRKNTQAQAEAQAQAQEAKVFTFGEKVQYNICSFELLKLNSSIASKTNSIDALLKKDLLTQDEQSKLDEYRAKRAEMITRKEEYVKLFADLMLKGYESEDVVNDRFARMVAWLINPYKGERIKDNVYSIQFAGMFPAYAKVKTYFDKYLDTPDTDEKVEYKKGLIEAMDNMVNEYLPHDKSPVKLEPCADATFTVTLASYEKDTTTFVTKTYANPKNAMSGGYKPMHIHFVDTPEKPMVKNIVAQCARRFKWDKDGISKHSTDAYGVTWYIFMTALHDRLEFVEKVKTSKKSASVTIL